MTTTVRKGTGRPAAAAKRTKAAQNGSVTDPRAEYAATKVNDLRKLARERGWSSATRLDKAGLVELLAENPSGPPATAAAKPAAQATAPRSSAPKVRSFRPITPQLAGNGEEKAAVVASLLKDLGWKVKVDQNKLSGQKGEAVIQMVWTAKGAHVAADSYFSPDPDSKPRRIINVATCLKIARK